MPTLRKLASVMEAVAIIGGGLLYAAFVIGAIIAPCVLIVAHYV